MKVLDRLNCKWNFSCQKLVSENPYRPQVNAFAILSLLDLFWSQIQWRTAQCFSQLFRGVVDNFSPSEIRQLYSVSHRQQNILRLYVSMHYLIFMQKFNCLAKLLHIIDISSIYQLIVRLFIVMIFYQLIKITVSAIVHNHAELLTLLEKTPEFRNVGMLKQRHYLYLLNQVINKVRICNLLL